MSVVWGPSKWGEGRPGSRTDSEWAEHPEMEVQEAFQEGQNLTRRLKDSQSFEGRDGNRWDFEMKKGHAHARGRRGGSQLHLVEGCFYT